MQQGRRVPESVAAPDGVPLPTGPRYYIVPRWTPAQKALARKLRKAALQQRRIAAIDIATGHVPAPADVRERATGYVRRLIANGVLKPR